MFFVEIYTPRHIIAARHPLQAGNLHDAKVEMRAWLSMDGVVDDKTHFRLIDGEARVLIDKPILGAFD